MQRISQRFPANVTSQSSRLAAAASVLCLILIALNARSLAQEEHFYTVSGGFGVSPPVGGISNRLNTGWHITADGGFAEALPRRARPRTGSGQASRRKAERRGREDRAWPNRRPPCPQVSRSSRRARAARAPRRTSGRETARTVTHQGGSRPEPGPPQTNRRPPEPR